MAPVRGHRTRRGLRTAGIGAPARSRRYSETLIPSFLAWDRIIRASSTVTLNVIVGMSNTVLPEMRPVNFAEFRDRHRTIRFANSVSVPEFPEFISATGFSFPQRALKRHTFVQNPVWA
jgi:hypothetical protein